MNLNYSTIDNYKIIKTLGEGFSGKVKLAEDKNTKKKYAIKLVKLQNNDSKTNKIIELLKKECQIMKTLNHKNIIKLIKAKKGLYISKSKQKMNVIYVVLELAPKGEIFDLIYYSGKFNENVTRYYARQLSETLNYLHFKNIAHRDLKPENLLLDENLDIKLADFGFSTFIKKDKNMTLIGTRTYMAPEIISQKPYNAKKADIFALGVILFTFYFGKPPFHDACINDVYYKTFIYNRKSFWEFHMNGSSVKCSKKFMKMIEEMLEFNFEERIGIEELINCEWMQESVDFIQAKKDIKVYYNKLQSVIKKSEMDKEYEKELKSSSLNKFKREDTIIFKVIEDNHFYPHVILRLKNKEEVVEKIIDAFYGMKDEFNGTLIWDENKTKISFRFINVHNNVVVIKLKFYIIGEDFGIKFLKKEGRSFDYYEIKQKIIDCLEINV